LRRGAGSSRANAGVLRLRLEDDGEEHATARTRSRKTCNGETCNGKTCNGKTCNGKTCNGKNMQRQEHATARTRVYEV
jgi:hypothetical protein